MQKHLYTVYMLHSDAEIIWLCIQRELWDKEHYDSMKFLALDLHNMTCSSKIIY